MRYFLSIALLLLITGCTPVLKKDILSGSFAKFDISCEDGLLKGFTYWVNSEDDYMRFACGSEKDSQTNCQYVENETTSYFEPETKWIGEIGKICRE